MKEPNEDLKGSDTQEKESVSNKIDFRNITVLERRAIIQQRPDELNEKKDKLKTGLPK